MLTPETYAAERAICDKANAYAAQFIQPNGWTIIPAKAAGHPDYAACDNAMRSRVELFELNRDQPERFSAYLVDQNAFTDVTTWAGDKLGDVTYGGPRHRNNFGGRWRQVTVRTIWGQTYTGREYDSRQLVNLRRVKG